MATTQATARELMTPGAHCAETTESLVDAARKMRDLGVGSLPICGEDRRLHGMLTDRDIVIGCLAVGNDPNTTPVEQFADAKPVTIGADDDLDEAVRTMSAARVRRLPVIDGQELVGMISQGDLAKALPRERVGELLDTISD